MYLSHIRLNPARRGTRFLLASPQRIHAAVLHGFPDLPPGGRVLWRLDQPTRHELSLLVTSPTAPDFAHVIEQAGWPTKPEETWRTRDYRPFLDRLDAGQRWAFRLRANPVRRTRDDKGRAVTLPHVTVAQQERWLIDRAESLGAAFPADAQGEPLLTLTSRSTRSFQRRSAPPGQGREVTIASAQFDGLLEVTDPDRLRTALTEGIGRAKAYGCGLMTLAAPRS